MSYLILSNIDKVSDGGGETTNALEGCWGGADSAVILGLKGPWVGFLKGPKSTKPASSWRRHTACYSHNHGVFHWFCGLLLFLNHSNNMSIFVHNNNTTTVIVAIHSTRPRRPNYVKRKSAVFAIPPVLQHTASTCAFLQWNFCNNRRRKAVPHQRI